MEALESQANELWLSPITVWEAAILAERGRITLDRSYSQWIVTALQRVPFTEAAVTHCGELRKLGTKSGKAKASVPQLKCGRWVVTLVVYG